MAVSASAIAAKDRTDERCRLGQTERSDSRGWGIRLERSGGLKRPGEVPAAHCVSGYSGQSGITRVTDSREKGCFWEPVVALLVRGVQILGKQAMCDGPMSRARCCLDATHNNCCCFSVAT
jgi:hypothetical protein